GPPVALEGERVGVVPVRRQLRQDSGHRESPFGVQPCSLALRRPASEGGPAVCPPAAWSSGNPARIREACFQVHSRGAPRVGAMSLPPRSPSTRSLADCGVMLSKNSQLTITTGA